MSDQAQKPILPRGRERPGAGAQGCGSSCRADPGASLITSVLQVSVPPKLETDREAWQEAISELTNQNTGRIDQHERQLNPVIMLTGTPVQLAVALAKACPDGLGYKRFDLDHLCKLLPETGRDELEERPPILR